MRRGALAALFTIVTGVPACSGPEKKGVPTMNVMSEQAAQQRAEEFLRDRSSSGEVPAYDIDAMVAHGPDSIEQADGEYRVRYTKRFHEPTKQNPPDVLIVVDRHGEARWVKQE